LYAFQTGRLAGLRMTAPQPQKHLPREASCADGRLAGWNAAARDGME
jgi:hypothetical protein